VRFLRSARGTLLRFLLSALMDVSALLPFVLFVLALAWDGRLLLASPGYWPFLLLYAAAGLLESALPEGSPGQVRLRRLSGGVAGAAFVYWLTHRALGEASGSSFTFLAAVAVVPAAWFTWGWGAEAAASGTDYYTVYDRFKLRVALLLGGSFLLVIVAPIRTAVGLLLYWNVILFFVTSLLLLFSARQYQMRTEQRRIGDEQGSGGEEPALTWAVLALVAVSLLAAHLLSVSRLTEALVVLFQTAGPLLDWFWDVLLLLLYPYIYLAMWLLNLLFRLLKQQAMEPEEEEITGGLAEEVEVESEMVPDREESIWPRVIAAAIGAAILLWWMWRLRTHRRQGLQQESDEIRESLGFWQQLKADLAALLGHLFSGRREGAGEGAEALPDDGSARALFRRLQRWGAGLGRPRRPQETPLQYEAALLDRQAAPPETIGLLTSLYNRTRYGKAAPPDPELREGRKAIALLESVGTQEQGRET
jgi:hypothetical protein